MKNLIIVLTLSALCLSCSESSPQPESKVSETEMQKNTKDDQAVKAPSENGIKASEVTKKYWNLVREKDIENIPNYIHPSVIERVDQKSISQTYYAILNNPVITFENVELSGDLTPIGKDERGDYFVQKINLVNKANYSDKTPEEFQKYATDFLEKSPDCIIDNEDQSILITSELKQLLLETEKGAYLLPDMFFRDLSADDIELGKIINAYMALP